MGTLQRRCHLMIDTYLLLLIATPTFEATSRPDNYYVRPTAGLPWPWPRQLTFGSSNLTISSDTFTFDVVVGTNSCPILDDAITRYKQLIFAFNSTPNSNDDRQLTKLVVQIDHSPCESLPYLGMDENYTLSINDNGTGLLKSGQIWGALRGLETFSQLCFPDNINGKTWMIRTTLIIDYPRFTHRGLLLDTSRHYLSMNVLLRNLDLMAQNKLNVFHWHIVDDHSFPYVSKIFPNLHKKGAFTSRHIYTPQDVNKIVDYARFRGIRVMPEFDTPGHTLSWGPGQPNLLTSCYTTDKDGNEQPDGTYGPIDPTFTQNYDFLASFFKEALHQFPDRYVHLGGDEVSFQCWKSNPKIRQFMKDNNISSYEMLEEYYLENLIKLSISRARKRSKDIGYVVWQEVIDNGVNVKPDTVAHVWKGDSKLEWSAELDKVTKKNLTAILSSCWYLNYVSYGKDWPKYYACDPQDFNGSEIQKRLVIGGEACMWGEYIDNTNVISLTWPRASAVAERLWSEKNLTSADDLTTARFEEHRCRMLRRGYNVAPNDGPGFCPFEWPGQ